MTSWVPIQFTVTRQIFGIISFTDKHALWFFLVSFHAFISWEINFCHGRNGNLEGEMFGTFDEFGSLK